MRKTFLAIALTLSMAAGLVGCSGNSGNNENKATATPVPTNSAEPTTEPTAEPSNNDSGKTVEDAAKKIEAAVAAALGDNYYCDTEVGSDELFLVGLADLDTEQVNELVVKDNSISSVNPDAIIVIDCKDGYADTALQYLQDFYTNSQEYQKLYPFAVEKVNNTRIYKAGNVVMLILVGGETPETDAEAFVEAEYAKADEAVKSVLGYLPENLAK